jgi:hypothetical protein
MIIEARTYTVDPHKLKLWLGLWEAKAKPVLTEHIEPFKGRFLGMYVSEIGALNDVLSLWQHVDLSALGSMRSAVAADVRWSDYLKAVDELAPMMVMRNSILKATSFSPQELTTPPSSR